MDKKNKTEWHCICASVRGASHKRSEQPNQDAVKHSEVNEGVSLIVAVSDGHGAAKYFRSDRGALFAVEAAIGTLSQFYNSLANSKDVSSFKEQVTKSLVNTWRDKVNAHLKNEPITEPELERLKQKEGSAAKQIVEENAVLAYGATLLAVMIAEPFIVYLQLGDGDILTVSEQGSDDRVFPVNNLHVANETTSLCTSDAWRDCEFRREEFSPPSKLPALILLSTDGYKDSFRSYEDFRKVGLDLFEMFRSKEAEAIKDNLSGWLSETSRIGSGDDITLGILYRIDAFKHLDVPHSTEPEHVDRTKGGNLEPDEQSSHCHGSLQP